MTKTQSKNGHCPICGETRPKPRAENRYHPFCGKRCADIDLGRWFNGGYTIPAVEPPDEWEMDQE